MGKLINLADACGGLLPIVRVIRKGVMPIFQIGIPILLILFGCIDLGKAVISSDDKAIKESTSKLIKRCVAAIAVFFVVTIVELLMGIISSNAGQDEYGNDVAGSASGWKGCWEAAK